ncbi:MAG TPA: hypothetical protein VF490_02665, partial [Chryseosolibacter sp.]
AGMVFVRISQFTKKPLWRGFQQTMVFVTEMKGLLVSLSPQNKPVHLRFRAIGRLGFPDTLFAGDIGTRKGNRFEDRLNRMPLPMSGPYNSARGRWNFPCLKRLFINSRPE